ncbi:MAG TPA: divalent-cation tolerance protein CutA [Syntrophales bacterium]|nr:divalent-cation tolerance protein CutA [Syntrophales bacterium]
MGDFIQVTTTTSSKIEAETISRALLEKRLAACVQVVGPIESHYWWHGKIEQSGEWLCIIKTIRGRFPAVESVIRANHTYEVPEIVACPIEEGSEPYLEWLRNETAG